MTNPCAIPDCETAPDGRRVFCAGHWTRLSLEVREALRHAGQIGPKPLALWRAAMKSAVAEFTPIAAEPSRYDTMGRALCRCGRLLARGNTTNKCLRCRAEVTDAARGGRAEEQEAAWRSAKP